MNQALYRKYRSKSFDEVIGQDHVTETLQKAIKAGRISHAYLFTGPKGVGKTSVARILAREVNDLQFEGESAHLDIIEIDAASNRRIDEIRDLRERVRIAPAIGKYKVYIIDEVHMLTKEAFNALLKTLEEPPAHAIFILATTEAHKLPETIVSRTQRFEFKPIPPSQAAKQLESIAKSEKIEITAAALELLATFGNGSFRDSISYLDQLSSTGSKVTEDDVRRVLGWPSEDQIIKLLAAVKMGDSKQLLDLLQTLKDSGIDAATAASSLSLKIRQELIQDTGNSNIGLLKQLLDVPASDRPYDRLELALLESAMQKSGHPKPDEAENPVKNEIKNSEPAAAAPLKVLSGRIKSTQQGDVIVQNWQNILDNAKQKAASIYTALKLAEPQYEDGKLVLKFKFPLHQKKLALAKNKDLVSELIEEMTGLKVAVDCVVDKQSFENKPTDLEQAVSLSDEGMHSITNIFGNAELMDS